MTGPDAIATGLLPSGPVHTRRLPPWMPLLVVAVAWAAQGAVLRNGWVWDDAILVRDGTAVARGFAAVPELVTGTWGQGEGIDVGLFRPLVAASLAIQAAVHGVGDPFPFHLVNLMLHGLAAVLLLALVNRLLPHRPVVAAASALLFAAHPLHTGTVSWIVARGDLLAAVFSLAAALVWTRRRGLDAVAAVLVATLYFLALLSKEMAAPLPLVLLLLHGAPGRTGAPRPIGAVRALRARWGAFALLAVAAIGWWALRAGSGADAALGANAVLGSRNVFERTLVGAGALVRMAARIAVPAGLSGDASNDPVVWARADLPVAYAVAAALVLLVTLVLVVRVVQRRAGVVEFCVAAFGALSLPVLQIVPIGAVFEDRFAYLPSLALLPVAGLAAERLLAARARRAALVACGAVVVACVAACWAVASDWRDDDAFDRSLLADDPLHLAAIDRLSRRLVVEALDARRTVAQLPTRETVRIRALLARQRSMAEEAVRLLDRARATPRGRGRSAIHESLGDAYAALPQPNDLAAREAYERHLALRTVTEGSRRVPVGQVRDVAAVPWRERRSVARVYDALARSRLALEPDDLAGTAALVDRAAAWNSSSFDLVRRAGIAWLRAQEPARALPLLERALALNDRDRALSAEDRARLERSIEETRERVAAVDDTPARVEFARGVAANDRASGKEAALRHFTEATRLDPLYFDAYVQIAEILNYKGALRDALAAIDDARVALDKAGAPANDARRGEVERLRAKYEKRRNEPDDPDDEKKK